MTMLPRTAGSEVGMHFVFALEGAELGKSGCHLLFKDKNASNMFILYLESTVISLINVRVVIVEYVIFKCKMCFKRVENSCTDCGS